MGSHHSALIIKDEWLTPPSILKELGVFDLDPCAPKNRPWDMANHHYTIDDNGLEKNWFGRVWCNPPYGLKTKYWLQKCAEHNNAISLIFARTETEMFVEHVWKKASALLFIYGRLFFHHSSGEKAKSNSGAPSVLVSYGDECAKILSQCNIEGKFIQLI